MAWGNEDNRSDVSSIAYKYEILWHEHIFKNIKDEDVVKAFQEARRIYYTYPSYAKIESAEKLGLMEAKHKAVYEYILKLYPPKSLGGKKRNK